MNRIGTPLIMAEAGLQRMEWPDRISGVLPIDEMLPAPAQGALAVEARLEDERAKELLQTIHDADTAVGVLAERSFLTALEGGCQVPIAAYAIVDGDKILLHGLLANLDGSRFVRKKATGPATDPEELGRSLAASVVESGGQEIINDLTS